MTTSAPERSLFDRVFADPDTGQLAIVQMPNAPLIVFLVSAALRVVFHPHGLLGSLLSAAGLIGLTVWAGLEVVRGDSLFRRSLGGIVLVGMVVLRLLR